MKQRVTQPIGTDADGHKGTRRAIEIGFGVPLLPDAAADAAFAGMIERLRGEPGSKSRREA